MLKDDSINSRRKIGGKNLQMFLPLITGSGIAVHAGPSFGESLGHLLAHTALEIIAERLTLDAKIL